MNSFAPRRSDLSPALWAFRLILSALLLAGHCFYEQQQVQLQELQDRSASCHRAWDKLTRASEHGGAQVLPWGQALSWAPRAVLAARPGLSAAPEELKPGSQARLLGSPNSSLQEQAEHGTSPSYQQTGSQQGTAPLRQELPFPQLYSAMSAVRGVLQPGKAGVGKDPAQDSGFVQMLSLIAPINFQDMCQEYSLAP